MNAIYILWLRQLKRYWRSKPRMIGSLGQPLLFLLGLGFGFGPIYQKAGGGNYMQFLAPGIVAMSIMFTAVFTGIEVIWDRQFGFLKETLAAPVPRFIIMFGRTLGGATVATMQGVIVFLIAMAAGFRPHNLIELPLALVSMFLIALLYTAFGTAIACKLEDMQAFPLIMNFLVMPMFFLSGSLFPVQGTEGAISVIYKINPLSYGVDALRGAMVDSTVFGYGTDFMVLLVGAAVCVGIGSYLFSRIEI